MMVSQLRLVFFDAIDSHHLRAELKKRKGSEGGVVSIALCQVPETQKPEHTDNNSNPPLIPIPMADCDGAARPLPMSMSLRPIKPPIIPPAANGATANPTTMPSSMLHVFISIIHKIASRHQYELVDMRW
mmetsp:Transcript_31424/g.67980  ORF Transcript_31424/g.67980 Transcript_31424/m.67980 type:complete len:130 (+) Transcript_31424:111-500(+)